MKKNIADLCKNNEFRKNTIKNVYKKKSELTIFEIYLILFTNCIRKMVFNFEDILSKKENNKQQLNTSL